MFTTVDHLLNLQINIHVFVIV